MKIVLFVENNHCGGMDTFFANLINYWPHAEDEFILIGNYDHPGLPNIARALVRPCRIIGHRIPLNWQIAGALFGWLPRLPRRAMQLIFRFLLLPLQFRQMRRLFETLGGDRLLVVNGAYPGGESCRIASIVWGKMGRLPGIHNIRNFAMAPRPLTGWFENWMDRQVVENTHCFIGVSRSCAESLRSRPACRRLDNIRHIYNGVRTEREIPASTVNLRDKLGIGNAPMCLMLGTYEPRKGHRFLFEAFLRVQQGVPEAHLVICGHGTPDEVAAVETLRRTIAPGAHIHLLEFIPGGSGLIAQADVLAIASQEWESFGWTAIEAMSLGVAVVSTNSGGLAEVVGPDGESGFCVPPDDVEGYAHRLSVLLRDAEMRKFLGAKGRERMLKMFTVERMVGEYAEIVRAP